jgi:hypothetical protein
MALTPKDAYANGNWLNTLTGTYTSMPDTCGHCHYDWSGGEMRNNFGAVRYNETGGSGNLTAFEQTADPDLDGPDSDTEFTAGNFGGLPDRDGDGYIALYYRNGPVLGWDVDDNDAGQGNIAWSTDPDTGNPDNNTNDNTAPSKITDFRIDDTLGSAQLNLKWSAPDEDQTATGSAHHYDIRYTTESLVSTYNSTNATNYRVREPADWDTLSTGMWDIPDCNVDGSANQYNPITESGQATVAPGCKSGPNVFWNEGNENTTPLIRAFFEPVPQAYGTLQTHSILQWGADAPANIITNSTLYWVAMRTSDGVVIPSSFENPNSLIRENLSAVSNIVAITAGNTGTAVGIKSFNTSQYSVQISQAAGQTFTVEGIGFTSPGIDTVILRDVAGGNSVTCDPPASQTDTSFSITCDASLLPAGFYDVDLESSTTLKASWVDAVEGYGQVRGRIGHQPCGELLYARYECRNGYGHIDYRISKRHWCGR